jgi:acetyl-CoA carboxylase carboxyltransferase component
VALFFGLGRISVRVVVVVVVVVGVCVAGGVACHVLSNR